MNRHFTRRLHRSLNIEEVNDSIKPSSYQDTQFTSQVDTPHELNNLTSIERHSLEDDIDPFSCDEETIDEEYLDTTIDELYSSSKILDNNDETHDDFIVEYLNDQSINDADVTDNRYSLPTPIQTSNGFRCSFCKRKFTEHKFFEMHLCTTNGRTIFQ